MTGAVAAYRPSWIAPAALANQPGAPLQLSGDTFEIDELLSDAPRVSTPADLEPVPSRSEPAPRAASPVPPPRRAEPAAEPAAAPSTVAAAEPAEPSPSPSSKAATTPSRKPAARQPPRPKAPTATPPSAPSTSSERASAGRAPASGASAKRGSDTAPPASGNARAYGAAIERDGRLLLAPYFTRAIPAAVSADPVWSRLPVGSAGRVQVTIVLDDDGAIVRTTVPSGTAKHLDRLVVRTTALLRAGRFALTRTAGAGREILQIDVTLTQQPPLEREHARPTDALELGYDPPAEARPGRAYFTLASGRRFEAHVAIVVSTPSPAAAAPTVELDAGVTDGANAD